MANIGHAVPLQSPFSSYHRILEEGLFPKGCPQNACQDDLWQKG